MAIGTYTELQTALQNWLDDTAGAQIPAARCAEFIALAEADINRRLRVREQITETTLATGAATETVTLPTDFGAIVSVSVPTGGSYWPLAQLDADTAIEAYYAYGQGMPRNYVIESAALRLYPVPDAAYNLTLRYYAKVPALTDVAPTNWLLTAHPDVYLFGSLVQASEYRVDDARVPRWLARYEAALGQVLQQSAADSVGRTFMYTENATP